MKLIRVAQSKEGTFGVLVKDNLPLCLTLEDPWNDNKKQISCIPSGTYKFSPHNGKKYKGVWIAENVPGRSDILIHQGNTIDDTMGCILVGKAYGKVNGRYGILNSTITLNELRDKLPSTFELEIINVY